MWSLRDLGRLNCLVHTDIERTIIHPYAELDKSEDVVVKSLFKLREDIALRGFDSIQ